MPVSLFTEHVGGKSQWPEFNTISAKINTKILVLTVGADDYNRGHKAWYGADYTEHFRGKVLPRYQENGPRNTVARNRQ